MLNKANTKRKQEVKIFQICTVAEKTWNYTLKEFFNLKKNVLEVLNQGALNLLGLDYISILRIFHYKFNLRRVLKAI